MKTKRVFSVLCAAAVMLSSLTIGISSYSSAANTYAEEMPAEEAEETKELAAPQNLRYEDGFIKWDKVEEAYGYTLRMHTDEEDYQEFTKYFDYDDPDDEAQVELDRLCFEYDIDFGEYIFDVCIFDETQNRSEWSDTITAEYVPMLDAPTNVRFSEENKNTVEWDEVEGAYRYNIRVYKDDDDHTLYYSTYEDYGRCSHTLWNLESGNYLISVQAIDQDYNASEWTEQIMFTVTSQAKLGTPQNVRFDETGENILWDEVEGAEYYWVRIYSDIIDESGKWFSIYESDYPNEPCCNNWKSLAVPISNTDYSIYVIACANGRERSDESKQIRTSFEMTRDESIFVPEMRLEDDILQWNESEDANKYWITISINGKYQEISGSYCYVGFDASVHYDECYSFNTYQFPIGTYDVDLYVVDQNNNYNKRTFSFTFGQFPDESVWVPKMICKSNEIFWDYDRFRHDKTDCFWIRVINEKDGTIILQQKMHYEHFYDFWTLPNGDYIIEVCACEYDENWTYKIGNWYQKNIGKHGESGFDKENESTVEIVPPPEIEETIPEEDRITSITINPAFNMKHKDGDDVEIDLSKIEIKANEIYDEEGLKRVEEALGHKIKPNQKYNLLDLTLLYNGEDFSNGYEGLVQVIIPIPAGHKDKTFTVYRLIEVDGETVKELIPGEQTEDSYIIYLEHFSEYALFGEGDHTHDFTSEWVSDETNHWKECECGEKSDEAEHAYTDWTVTKEATETEEGSKERTCETCGYKQTETISALSHTHIFGEEWKTDESNHWKECECGEKSDKAEHSYTDWTITKEATAAEEGSRERSCETCGYKQIEALPKLTPAVPTKPEPEPDMPIYITDYTGASNDPSDTGTTDSTDNSENTGNTGNTGNTSSTGNTGSTIGTGGSNDTDSTGNTSGAGGMDNTNNADKTDKPESGAPDDGNPSTGIAAISTSIVVLSVCGAAIVLTSMKRKNK